MQSHPACQNGPKSNTGFSDTEEPVPNLRSRLLTIRAAEQEAAAIGGSHWQGIASEEMLAGYKDNPKIDSKTRYALARSVQQALFMVVPSNYVHPPSDAEIAPCSCSRCSLYASLSPPSSCHVHQLQPSKRIVEASAPENSPDRGHRLVLAAASKSLFGRPGQKIIFVLCHREAL